MTYTIKRGDTAQTWTDTLRLNGSAINLNGATVKLILKRTGSSAVERTATIVSAAAGQVSYTPIAADVATVGTIEAEWEITFSNQTILTVPNDSNIRIKVISDLNPPA